MSILANLLLALAPAPDRLALPENADGQDTVASGPPQSSSKREKHTVSCISQCISRSCHGTPRIASGWGWIECPGKYRQPSSRLGSLPQGLVAPWTSVRCCLSRGLPVLRSRRCSRVLVGLTTLGSCARRVCVLLPAWRALRGPPGAARAPTPLLQFPDFLLPRTDHCQMSDLSGCLPPVTGTQHCPFRTSSSSCWFSPSPLCRRRHWATGQCYLSLSESLCLCVALGLCVFGSD
ncbi:hypothetical protein C8R47DRAFT_569749 [Mycena vitilis]|nr:hypothetical protein C8R47DRAFT_569749 [Mycena vitilis]